MTARSGVTHSKFNASCLKDVRFLQIWITSNRLGLEPRYPQEVFGRGGTLNQLCFAVSPDGVSRILSFLPNCVCLCCCFGKGSWVQLSKRWRAQCLDSSDFRPSEWLLRIFAARRRFGNNWRWAFYSESIVGIRVRTVGFGLKQCLP